MSDAVATLIKQYDLAGRYFDRSAMERLQSYFSTGSVRIEAAQAITLNAADIVKSAALRLFDQVPELLRPGGNAYTTRRYATCLRDMDYFLRYASYALVGGSNAVLDIRVLAGLRETYNSLGVPLGPIVCSIENMKDEVLARLGDGEQYSFVAEPFDYMAAELGETDI
ncbi:MAG: allophycocyanin subunit beta [Cyanobacteria bacterium J06642_2]